MVVALLRPLSPCSALRTDLFMAPLQVSNPAPRYSQAGRLRLCGGHLQGARGYGGGVSGGVSWWWCSAPYYWKHHTIGDPSPMHQTCLSQVTDADTGIWIQPDHGTRPPDHQSRPHRSQHCSPSLGRPALASYVSRLVLSCVYFLLWQLWRILGSKELVEASTCRIWRFPGGLCQSHPSGVAWVQGEENEIFCLWLD